MSSVPIESSVDELFEGFFWQNSVNLVLKDQKYSKNSKIFSQRYFPQKSHLDTKYSFDKTTKLFSPKFQNVFHKVWKHLAKIKTLRKKKQFFKNILWTHRMQFLKPGVKIFDITPLKLWSKLEKNCRSMHNFSRFIFSSKTSSVPVKGSIYELFEGLLSKLRKLTAQNPEIRKKFKKFLTKVLSTKISSRHFKYSFDNQTNFFCPNSE